MGTKRTKPEANLGDVDALEFLRNLSGGPLTFARYLQSIRLGEEASQAEFADQLGISKAHLCDIEKGRRAVSPQRAATFAELLGYAPEQFVELALQAEIDRAGLGYRVHLTAA